MRKGDLRAGARGELEGRGGGQGGEVSWRRRELNGIGAGARGAEVGKREELEVREWEL